MLTQRLEEQTMLKSERADVRARDALKRAIVCGAGQPPCGAILLLPEPEVRRASLAQEKKNLSAEATRHLIYKKNKK